MDGSRSEAGKLFLVESEVTCYVAGPESDQSYYADVTITVAPYQQSRTIV